MFDWITNALANLFGGGGAASASSVQAALNRIADIFHALYGYLHAVFGNVIGGWSSLTAQFLAFRGAMIQFVSAQYWLDAKIQWSEIPWLANWITWLQRKEQADIDYTITALSRQDTQNYNSAISYAKSILEWLLRVVIGLITGQIAEIFGWIANEGAFMFRLLTHLDELAAGLFWFLVDLLEALAWDAAKRLGTFFLSLIVHNVTQFATLVETIIDAVL